jgi:ABC-type transporter Mla subunit MlaD
MLLHDLAQIKRELTAVDAFLKENPGTINGERLEHFNVELGRHKLFGECWDEFAETLVPVEDNGQVILYNTQRASVFVNSELLVEKNVGVSLYQAVPSILTGLGLFGTFLAIIWGLSSLTIDQGTGEVGHIKEFIGSLAGKFLSSLCGLLASIVFLILEKVQFGDVERKCLGIQNKLDRMFPQRVIEDMLSKIQKAIEEQSATHKHFSSQLANQLKQNIQESIEPTMRGIAEAMGRLELVTESLRHQKEESAAVLVDTIVSNFKSALTDHTSTELQELKEAMGATASLADEVTTHVTDLINHSQNLLKAQHEHAAELQNRTTEGLELVSSAFAKLAKDIEDSTREHVAQLRTVVSDMVEENRNWLTDFKQRFSADLNQQSEFNNSLQIKISQAIDNSINALEKAFDQHLNKVSERMDGVLEKLSDWTNKSSAELTNYANGLADQSSAIVSAGESIRAASTELDSMFKEQKEFLHSLKDAISTLRTVSASVSESAQKVSAIQEVSQQEIRALTTDINRNAEMFKSAEQLMNTQKEVYEALDGGIARSLKAINEATQEYSEHTRKSLGGYLSEFDKHLSDAVAQLDGTLHELGTVLGDFGEVVAETITAYKPESENGKNNRQSQESGGGSNTQHSQEAVAESENIAPAEAEV